jgi:hypothetical protein
MFKNYVKTFLLTTIGYLFTLAGLAVIVLIFTNGPAPLKFLLHIPVLVSAVTIFLFLVSYQTHRSVDHLSAMQKEIKKTLYLKEVAEKEAKVWKTSVFELSSGFPTLMNAIKGYQEFLDDELANCLLQKQRPAKRAAEIIKEEARRRREAEFDARIAQAIIEYYESIAPFLVDLKNDLVDARKDEHILLVYNEEERQDPVINYLTKEEYRKLSTVERNQLALYRFWQRPKSKRLLGRLYERYIGYLYEKEGYDVEYVGIFKGYEDLGRDLICQKESSRIIIQCKNWSHFKTIYEKHIFQFFGTVFQYKDSHPDTNVKAIFYTTTELSISARTFANALGIEIKENFKFDQSYPCIKCNINLSTKEKIYHLPFDQQYDNTKIINPGEFYCCTAREAEEAGFRRAFRWRGSGVQDGEAQAVSL